MEFSIFNPPPAVEIPEPPEPTLILPSSTSKVGCIALVAFKPNENILGQGEYLPSALFRGSVIDGAHLSEIAFNFLGNPTISPQRLQGQWQCLSRAIEEGGKAWGLVQRIQ